MEPTIDGMSTCKIGVKRADGEYKRRLNLQTKDITNSNNFAILCQQLRSNQKAAFFICEKTERGGFIVAMDDSYDACDYAAYCLVASIDELGDILNGHGHDNGNGNANGQYNNNEDMHQAESAEENDNQGDGLWKPPSNQDHNDDTTAAFDSNHLWKPSTPEHNMETYYTPEATTGAGAFEPENNDYGNGNGNDDNENDNSNGDKYHADDGAAAADRFYSTLTRSLNTRADSMLYHMRNFNGWVKATQIAELDPMTIDSSASTSTSASKKRKRTKHPIRILDLACGKGGDLGKWVLTKRGIANYVGIDVARGSLVDAALRARKMRQLDKCVFAVADLGSDVPGRVKSSGVKKMQKLMTWSLKDDDGFGDPQFRMVRGGGIAESDKFDVVRYVPYSESSQPATTMSTVHTVLA